MTGAVVVGVSLSSAFAFAVSTSLKHASAGDVPDAQNLDPRRLGRFIQATLAHRLWLGGVGADVIGLSLQVIALHLGALSVVQPLMLSGLVFALLLRQRFEHNITHREIGWAVALVAILAAFVTLAGTGAQHSGAGDVDRMPAVVSAVVGLVLAAVCVGLGRASQHGGRSAALLGVATGAVYAADAALLKAVSDRAQGGVLEVAESWQLYVVIVLGACGLLLNQLAFQAGPLTASLPAIATVDPLLSIVVGVAVYDEHIRRGPLAGIGLVMLLTLMGVTVIQLARAEHAPALTKDLGGDRRGVVEFRPGEMDDQHHDAGAEDRTHGAGTGREAPTYMVHAQPIGE